MLKMYTIDNKWIVVDGEREIEYDSAIDAWGYVFLMRGIRPKAPQVTESIYPVKTLNPFSSRKQKKIVCTLN